MEIPQDQIDELKRIAPSLSSAEEGGCTYILIEKLKLPGNCVPSEMDVLLLPMLKGAYQCRLYFSQIPSGIPPLNWNSTNVRILGRTWNAFSWITKSDLRLAEMLAMLLKPLRNEKK